VLRVWNFNPTIVLKGGATGMWLGLDKVIRMGTPQSNPVPHPVIQYSAWGLPARRTLSDVAPQPWTSRTVSQNRHLFFLNLSSLRCFIIVMKNGLVHMSKVRSRECIRHRDKNRARHRDKNMGILGTVRAPKTQSHEPQLWSKRLSWIKWMRKLVRTLEPDPWVPMTG
jgi:hypothetical protein